MQGVSEKHKAQTASVCRLCPVLGPRLISAVVWLLPHTQPPVCKLKVSHFEPITNDVSELALPHPRARSHPHYSLAAAPR